MKTRDNRYPGWLWPTATLGCLVILSWIIVHWDLDRAVAGCFYSDSEGWYLAKRRPWQWLYEFGTIPGIVLAVASLTAWMICFVKPRFHHLHRYFLIIVLTTVIGPGMLVNGVFKGCWGRPRPRQVQEFGGPLAYRHFYQPGVPGRGASFTCGHCSMGFLFFSLLVFRRKNLWVAVAGGVLGVVLGGLLGAARVVQGGHFVSDVLWSLGIVLLVLMGLSYLILWTSEARPEKPKPKSRGGRNTTMGLLLLCVGAMTAAFLLHRPFYKEHRIPLHLPPGLDQIVINPNTDVEKSAL